MVDLVTTLLMQIQDIWSPMHNNPLPLLEVTRMWYVNVKKAFFKTGYQMIPNDLEKPCKENNKFNELNNTFSTASLLENYCKWLLLFKFAYPNWSDKT